MTQVQHPPGTFCWCELVTGDSEAAKEFYTSLMGWESHDDPLPGGAVYTMLMQQGGKVGALYQRSAGMNPVRRPA
jgi:predicted enzyme related to lactoylglutathione lyase